MKLLIFLLVFIFISCTKLKIRNVCDCNDPIKELSWLSEIISNSQKLQLMQIQNQENIIHLKVYKTIFKNKSKLLLKKEEGFIVGVHMDNSADFDGAVFYDCKGNSLCNTGGLAGSICNDYEVLEEKIIYEN